jgi:catechol 2,3-dioxygenase-like lactoylglutathione lyase family enzyme
VEEEAMLTNAHFTAMLPVTDVARARRFYEEQLGLRARRTLPNGEVLFQSDGGEFALYPRPTPPQSDHTALSWDVPDVETEVRTLRERGVRFEDYPEMHTRDGIADMEGERAAWFKDPDGNILCIHQSSESH